MTGMPLPRLRSAWRSALAAPGQIFTGPVMLDGTVLAQRRGLLVHRVDLSAATSVVVRPRRPRRLAMRVGQGRRRIQVDLLNLEAIPGHTRTPEELEALAAGLERTAAPVAEALRRQATFLRGQLPEPYLSPLAPYVGASGTRFEDIGHALGGVP